MSVSVEAPLSLLDADSFWGCGRVPLATLSQVTCAEVAPVVPQCAPCNLVPWCITGHACRLWWRMHPLIPCPWK